MDGPGILRVETIKRIIPVPHSDRAFTPIETVSYACKGLSLSCCSLSLSRLEIIPLSLYEVALFLEVTHLLTLDIWCFDLFELFTYSLH